MSHSIPKEIGYLGNLENLYLNDNQLSGSLPPELGLLSKLSSFNIGSNDLESVMPFDVAMMCAQIDFCWLIPNTSSFCIPDTPEYQAIGVNPIGGLTLDALCQ